MLNQLRHFIKLSFNRRFLVSGVLFVSFSLFGSFPNLWGRFLALAVFTSCSALFVPFYFKESIHNFRQLWAFLTRTKLPIPTKFSELASRMHTKIRSFGIVEGRTAFVAFGSLVLGKDLIRDVSPKELLAVVAHELGHIKGRHGLKRNLSFIPLMVFALYSWSKLNSPIFYSEAFTMVMLSAMMLVALLAYMTVMMVPINWNLEYRADETAAKFAEKENIESALLKMAKAEKRDLEAQSETHPSIKERINRLEKLGHQQRSGRLTHFFKRIFSLGLS